LKTENKNEYMAPEKKHYKKKYLERKQEENEADQEIKEFSEEREEFYGNYGGTD